jgi:uncharacterized protein YndB with AHSA1/START domain
MTETGFGRFIDAATVQFERIFPHPVERVWRAITEPAQIAAWFEPMSLDLAAGGAWQMGTGGGWMGTITVLEPLRRVRFDHAAGRPDCDPGGYFQYELEPVVGGTRMRFTHHLPGVAGGLARDPNGVAGGWHELFDGLTEWLNGVAVGARLPATELSRTVEAWAEAKLLDGEFDAETARRHVLDLRREEVVAQLNRRYRERAAAGAGGQGDAGLGYAAPGRTWEMQPEGRRDVPWSGGNLGGWHEFWDALAAHLDGVLADERLPPTPLSALVADWVSGVQVSYDMDKKLGARVRIGLRRKERWAELNALYEELIDETLPPA